MASHSETGNGQLTPDRDGWVEQTIELLERLTHRWVGKVTPASEEPGKQVFLHLYNQPALRLTWRLANQPFFQRLQFIKQLGTTSLVSKADANHTRWAHSIGVVSLVGACLDNLASRGIEIDPEWRAATLYAALLHDAMQGPWSHSLEFLSDIFPYEHQGKTARLDKVLVRRELADKESELSSVLFDALRAHPHLDAERVLEKITIVLDSEMCRHQHPDMFFLAQLIDSEIDADRMDYIVRDNRYLGEPGEAELIQDVEEIVEGLDVCTYSLSGDTDLRVLAIPTSARGAAERILAKRQLAYEQVYEHPDKVAVDEMLAHSLFCLARGAGFFQLSDIRRVQPATDETAVHRLTRLLGLLTDEDFFHLFRLAQEHDIGGAAGIWAAIMARDAQVGDRFVPLAIQWLEPAEREALAGEVESATDRVEQAIRHHRSERGLGRTHAIEDEDMKDIWRRETARRDSFKFRLGLMTTQVNTYGNKLAVEKLFWARLLSKSEFREGVENYLENKFGAASPISLDDLADIPLIHISIPWHPFARGVQPYTTEATSLIPYGFYDPSNDGAHDYRFDPVKPALARTWLPFVSCPSWFDRYFATLLSEEWTAFVDDVGGWVI